MNVMQKDLDEFVNANGKLISSKIPKIDPQTSAKTTTDKSVRMRVQPFLYTVYRRFFSEGELPYTKEADKYKDNPKRFHDFLIAKGEGEKFEEYFQKSNKPKDKLSEISRIKAYEIMETILSTKKDQENILNKNTPTIEEIKNKEVLLIDKLTRLAEAIHNVMNEDEKKVILSYFSKKIKNG